MFPGAPAEWTADQRRLVTITKEYANAFQTVATYKQEQPKSKILDSYRKFRKWWVVYSKDPEKNGNPYKQYSRGFGVRK